MSFIEKDLRYIWHPCSQMKDYETFPPLLVKRAQGNFIELQDGTKVVDAISSWWCKSLGHAHPRLKSALLRQMKLYEHIIGANTCQEVLVKLSERLAKLLPGENKLFYASDGSCAVEIAIKMSLHSRKITGENQRTNILSLENAYHGETMLALSLSDLGLYKTPYREYLSPIHFLENIPYVSSIEDPVWKDCSAAWGNIEKQLLALKEKLSAIIIEPIVQGAAGMLIYSQDFLKRLAIFCKKYGIHLIADEIMTGFAKTGKMLACEHAQIQPDFICLSKGLTAGFLPMSAVFTNQSIYNLFYDDYKSGKAFLHSHTYSGNALAAAVALENLIILEEEQVCQKVEARSFLLKRLMQEIAENTGLLHNIRCIGNIVAADLIIKKNIPRLGFKIFQEAVKRGALLRPLENTIYWLPPLNIDDKTLYQLQQITKAAILAVII